MINFDDIQRANEQIKTTKIKNKEYAEVNQRIKAFRILYPQGFITTNLVSDNDEKCIITASVGYYNGETPIILATGTAFEMRADKNSFVNQTSYIENCETSAIGRALGMAGFGIDTSIASYEEVQNAINQQPIDKHNIMVITSLCEETKTDINKLLEHYKVKTIEELTMSQVNDAVARLQKKRADK